MREICNNIIPPVKNHKCAWIRRTNANTSQLTKKTCIPELVFFVVAFEHRSGVQCETEGGRVGCPEDEDAVGVGAHGRKALDKRCLLSWNKPQWNELVCLFALSSLQKYTNTNAILE